jgi:hypothetical protein
MTTMETDRLVDDYLRRLEAAGAHLERSRRAELVAEIREHIETALREEDEAGEAAVRNVLERLGPPEEIAEAAEPLPAEAPKARGGALEMVAVLALLVPFIGWLVGSVLVVVSQAWSRRDKLVGLTLALLPVFLPLLVVVSGSHPADSTAVPAGEPLQTQFEAAGDDGGTADAVILALALLAGLPSALSLGWRLRRHPASA